MKNAKIRKVLFTLIIVGILSLVLSIKGYAATKMLDELVVMNNSNVTNVLGADAGIYQTALNAYMDTTRTMNTEIAQKRTHYGKGENLKIRFSFSKAISSVSGLRLGIKFGNQPEKVVTADQNNVDGSYLTFSYNIDSEDNGGLQITFINGSVTDENGKSIQLGILGQENTWTNTIIAKGSWGDYTITPLKSSGESAELVTHMKIEMPANDPAYILDGTTIRPIKDSDIKWLRRDENGTAPELVKSGQGVTSIKIGAIEEIYIPNACDIAGNVNTITNVQSEKWYVLECNGNLEGDNYYCNAGKIIQFLRINGSKTTITIGGNSRNLTAGGIVADKVQQFSYTIADGDNGQVTTADGVAKNIIADTIKPKVNFKGIYLESGNDSYYSDGAINVGDKDIKNSGTIWVKPGAKLKIIYEITDTNNHAGKYSNCLYNHEGDFFECGGSIHVTEDGIETRTFTVTATKEGLCNAFCQGVDYAGNESIAKYLKDNVVLLCDTTGPNINITPNGTSTRSDSIEFSIAANDPQIKGDYYDIHGVLHTNTSEAPVPSYNGSGGIAVPISSVNVTNGKIIKSSTSGNTLSITVMPDGDGYVSVYVPAGATTDNVKNGSKESNIAKVRSDRTAPVIHDVTGVPTDWANNATLSVIASDAGVGGIQYSFNGGAYQDSNQCIVTSNGTVTVKVKDSLGNESEAKTVNITKIDSGNPTITGIDYHQGWTNQDVEVNIKATDEHSGVKEYSFDGGTTWQTSPKKIYSSTSTIAANQIKVRDFMGKEATYGSAVQIQIDRTAPTIDSVVVSPEELTRDNVIITVNAGDQGGSGLAGYSFNGGVYSTTNTYTVSKNGDVTIKVKDNAGNETSIVKTIENIIEPAISFDTTSEGTCIREVKTIDNVNYVVVPEGTTAENLLKYIISPYGLTIKKADNTDVSGDSIVATSYIINANIPCRVVVKGDVTGDGEVDLGDILRLNEYRLDSKKELTTAEFIAGNMIDTDDEINMSDILRLNEYRLNR